MTTVRENAVIEHLAAGMPRTDRQIGGLQQSDAELIRLPGTDTILAVTTDTIAEEIELGLYRDPYLIGWMAVIVNASDLAAVGATPLGILLNETLPRGYQADDRSKLQMGIRDACLASDLPVLGGDTNTAAHFQIGATALGLIETGNPMTRIGCKPGDRLFASGPLGLGTVHAITALDGRNGQPVEPDSYKPMPRIKESQMLRPYATACMDSSDGVLAVVDQLARLNDVGFVLRAEEALHPSARHWAERLHIPPWMMLAGLHGEFELVFTVSTDAAEPFLHHAASQRWQPVALGRVVDASGVQLETPTGRSLLDTARIRNLFEEPFRDIETIVLRLKSMEEPCTQ